MFEKFMIGTVVLGAGIGLMMPSGKADQKIDAVSVKPAAPPTQSYSADHVIEKAPNGHFYVEAMVNGQLIRFVVDTGATTVALTKADAQRAGIAFSTDLFSVIGRGASGDVRGEDVAIHRIAIGQKEAFDVSGVVLDDGLDTSLLGQSFLSQLGSLTISGDRMVLRWRLS